MGGGAKVGASPIDDLRASLEMAAAHTPSAAEREKNRAKTREDALSVTPVIGNIMSGESAVENYKAMAGADTWKDVAKHGLFGALDTVGAVTGLPWGKAAGAVAKGGKDRLNVFVGPEAKTANKAALQNAEYMRAQGASPESIWERTGWGWDERGLPYFEVDDSAAKLRPGTGTAPQTLGEFMDHPALFTARPDLADIKLTQTGPANSGRYMMPMKGQYFGRDASIDIGPAAPTKTLENTLHEAQHAADFERGGSFGASVDWANKADREAAISKILADTVMGPIYRRVQDTTAAKEALRAGGESTPEFARARNEWFDAMAALGRAERETGRLGNPSRLAYKNTPGEVRARNTAEQRRTMTDAERRGTAPWKTQDVRQEDVFADAPGGSSGTSQVFVPVEEGKLTGRARDMRDKGKSAHEVWDATGITVGPDGTMRRFLPNHTMDVDWGYTPGDVTTVGALVNHPTLFREMPEIQNRIVKVTDKAEVKPGQMPRGLSRTDPVTGDFEWSKAGGDPYADIAKLINYDVTDQVGFSPAGRHSFSDNLASLNKAQLDAALSPADRASITAYTQALERAKADVIGRGIEGKARFKDMDRRIGDRTAGSADAKIVRASVDRESGIGFPYDPTAPWIKGYWQMPAFEDMLVMPPTKATPDDMAQFVTDWYRYGSGRGR